MSEEIIITGLTVAVAMCIVVIIILFCETTSSNKEIRSLKSDRHFHFHEVAMLKDQINMMEMQSNSVYGLPKTDEDVLKDVVERLTRKKIVKTKEDMLQESVKNTVEEILKKI